MHIARYHRYWAVYEAEEVLLCLCVYRKGAEAVVARFGQLVSTPEPPLPLRPSEAIQESRKRYETQDAALVSQREVPALP